MKVIGIPIGDVVTILLLFFTALFTHLWGIPGIVLAALIVPWRLWRFRKKQMEIEELEDRLEDVEKHHTDQGFVENPGL